MSGTEGRESPLGWHVISGEDLLAMLRRVQAGEDPGLVYAEEYVNADREQVPPVTNDGGD